MPISISDELAKLSELHDKGQLSDEEFATAKRHLFSDYGTQTHDGLESESVGEKATSQAVGAKAEIYKSSRWSSGNLFFPDSLEVSSDGILFRKGAMFGSSKEFINYKAVASFRVKNGIFLATISIETSGGSQPIFINGLWKSDAQKIQDSIRSNQSIS